MADDDRRRRGQASGSRTTSEDSVAAASTEYRRQFLSMASALQVEDVETMSNDQLLAWSKSVARRAIGIAIKETGTGM